MPRKTCPLPFGAHIFMCCGFPYSVRYLAEPLMGPFARRGNKIAVRHEQNISAFVAPGDFIDPAVLADIFFFGSPVQQGKQLFYRRTELCKLRVIVYFAGRDCLTSYHFHQPFAVFDILPLVVYIGFSPIGSAFFAASAALISSMHMNMTGTASTARDT